MIYLKSKKRVMSTANWQERMGDITIEKFCKDNGYTQFEAPDDLMINLTYFTNGKFDINKYNAALNKEQAELELSAIQVWFNQNDWKVHKMFLGEWTQDDPRAIEYLKEREEKRLRRDELTNQIK